MADNLYKTLLSVVLRQNQNLTTSPTNAFNLNNPAVQNYLTAKLKGILPNATGAITENELMTAWLLANSGGGGGGSVTSVDISSNGTALTISGNPITTAGTIALDFNGANTDYIDGTGAVQPFPTITSGTVTTVSVVTNDGVSGTVANATTTPAITLDLGTITPDAVSILGSGGNGYLKLRSQSSTVPTPITGVTLWADSINRFGWVNPSAYAISLDDTGLTASRNYTLPNASGTLALTSQLTSGTVTSVAALTLGTTGTDLSSTVANSTTTPVITLNVPTASALNRGALSAADWTTFNNKGNGTVTSIATAGLISGGTITSSGTITTSVSTNKLVGRATAGTGVMEEITLGTGLSFTGTTLNVSGVAVAISTLTAAAATNTINNTNYLQEWQWNTLTSGTGLKLSSTATGATGSTQKILEIAQSGANANINQTTYALYVTNVKTGTGSLNHAAYFSASGGSGGNAAIIARNGSVVIGTEDNSLYSTYPLFIQGLGGPGTAYSAFFQGRLLINATNNSGIVLQSGTSSSMGIIGVSVVGDATFGSNTITFLTTSGGTTRMALNANLRMFGAGIGTSAVSVISLPSGTAPTTSPADCYQVYSADVVAGNAAAHYRTENGDIVKIYSIGGWGTPTGTLTRTTFATYAGATAGVLYDQTIMQNLIDAAKITSERLAALISDLKTGQQLLKA